MTDDLIQIFGKDFQGLSVTDYQMWPSIDGSWLGIKFRHPGGAETLLAFPRQSLDRLRREIKKANAICRDRQRQARH